MVPDIPKTFLRPVCYCSVPSIQYSACFAMGALRLVEFFDIHEPSPNLSGYFNVIFVIILLQFSWKLYFIYLVWYWRLINNMVLCKYILKLVSFLHRPLHLIRSWFSHMHFVACFTWHHWHNLSTERYKQHQRGPLFSSLQWRFVTRTLHLHRIYIESSSKHTRNHSNQLSY